MSDVRLQKYLAEAGVASRRKSEKLILDGRVEVNGRLVKELGTKVKPTDIVKVDGKKVGSVEKKIYIMLNKPIGYVTTVDDQFGRKTVLDLIEGVDQRIYPVGRLDYDSSGLLLMTNDGDFAYRLTHPKHQIDKVYHVKVKGHIDEKVIAAFKKGILLDGRRTAPATIRTLKLFEKNSLVEVITHEGRNRQVRRMLDSCGHSVLRLKRVAMGLLELGDLEEGSWRYLTAQELKMV
jgi:23S rRNA pseudouridine2605 synthase